MRHSQAGGRHRRALAYARLLVVGTVRAHWRFLSLSIPIALTVGWAATTPLAGTLIGVCVVGFVLLWRPEVRHNRESPPASTDGNRGHRVLFALPLLLIVVAIDAQAYFKGTAQPRFLLLALPFAVYALACVGRSGLWKSGIQPSYYPYAALTAYCLAGSIFGKLFLGTVNPAVSIGLAAFVGLILVRLETSEAQARNLVKAVGFSGLLYVALNAVALTGYADFFSSDPSGNYRHEKAWILAGTLVALMLSKQRVWAGAGFVMSLYIFSQYPAATYVIVLMVTITTVGGAHVLSSYTNRALSNYAVAGFLLLLGCGAFIVANMRALIALADTYFTSVGKQDNTDTRLVALQLAWDQVKQSPMWGSLYTGDLSLKVPSFQLGRTLTSIEAHNDYLTTWMLGGLVALTLLVLWIFRVNVEAIASCRRFNALGYTSHRSLVVCVLVLFNAFWTVAVFNPLLTQLSAAATIAMAYSALHALSSYAHRTSSSVPDEPPW